jgi:hypothetical protein
MLAAEAASLDVGVRVRTPYRATKEWIVDRRRLLGTAAAAAGVALIPGKAVAAGDDLAAQVRSYLDRALAAGAPSAVFGVIRGGRRYVAGAGQDGPAPDGKTVFQLGSIGKTLTATALARAVGAGTVRLYTPLSLPSGFTVPRGETRRITLRDLATHSSGLPSLPANLLAEADPYNPYAHYTLEDLAAGLPQTPLNNEPGSAYAYSNLGFGLLGQALAFDGVDAMLQRRWPHRWACRTRPRPCGRTWLPARPSAIWPGRPFPTGATASSAARAPRCTAPPTTCSGTWMPSCARSARHCGTRSS